MGLFRPRKRRKVARSGARAAPIDCIMASLEALKSQGRPFVDEFDAMIQAAMMPPLHTVGQQIAKRPGHDFESKASMICGAGIMRAWPERQDVREAVVVAVPLLTRWHRKLEKLGLMPEEQSWS